MNTDVIKQFMEMKMAAECLTHEKIDNQTVALLLVADRLNKVLLHNDDITDDWGY
jgi:hypothetical protein